MTAHSVHDEACDFEEPQAPQGPLKPLNSREDWVFSGELDETILGSNPEHADLDNPQGHVYGWVGRIEATNSYGDRRVSPPIGEASPARTPIAQQEISAMAAALNTRLSNLRRLPVGFEEWMRERPVYGSRAYQDYGAAEDLEREYYDRMAGL